MLSELFQLARNLAVRGIDTPLVHPNFGEPGLSSKTTLRVVLCEKGAPASVAVAATSGDVETDKVGVGADVAQLSLVTQDDQAGFWTLKQGNFGFFPAVRLATKRPLLKLAIVLIATQN